MANGHFSPVGFSIFGHRGQLVEAHFSCLGRKIAEKTGNKPNVKPFFLNNVLSLATIRGNFSALATSQGLL
jgi:hypothetical protein